MHVAPNSHPRQTKSVRVEYDILIAINERYFDRALQLTWAIAAPPEGSDECPLIGQMPDSS
jgi:hypothetical protein